MFVLDTDLVSILQERSGSAYDTLRHRMANYDHDDYYITVVTSHEQFMGANKYIAHARSRAELLRGYRLIEAAMMDYQPLQTSSCR